MNVLIYNPLEEFATKYRDIHAQKTEAFFEDLVRRSGIDIEENRALIKNYNAGKESLAKLRKQLGWLKFLRVLMCITLVLIPLVILKTTPKIKQLREEIESADKHADELLSQAQKQMMPLNVLFSNADALNIIEQTLPMLSFRPSFSAEQELDMRRNYDFTEGTTKKESTIDVLSGTYNDNPFLFEQKLIQTMGCETYRGYRTISWTERYRDADGKWRTITKTQTLEATVTKPKPYYHKRNVLNYCAQGGSELSFSRDASYLHNKSEKQIERMVKRGDKKLDKKTDKAISQNSGFMRMSNTEFEVLFDALDRTNEVQFRTLFTPLAQTNMVDLILSDAGFGDDFEFVKTKRTNKIISKHSQTRDLNLLAKNYISYSYDVIKDNFINKNTEFFKAIYFDFAPLWAIPIYQERPTHSLDPIPPEGRQYSLKEYEVLSNAVDKKHIVHPNSKTEAILNASFLKTNNGTDEICVTAFSFNTQKRIECVPVRGDDGHFHNVEVEWLEYLPLEAQKNFFVSTKGSVQVEKTMASHNDLCIFHA